MDRLEEIIKTLKAHIGESVEAALEYLEQVLDHESLRYNDFVQIKSRYNSLQRELLLGVLDHSTYDISRNNISKALLLLADDITEKDLGAENAATGEEDKRGEILYHVPDLMQVNHEEKCTVRIAFEAELLMRDWEKTEVDVIKSIRVSEIMAVSLLNVDENDPPFAIRSFSETVQFVDKDDFTEWVFYVKPLKTGRFPLVLRVSVIEMINNKEYKKDIVLEEEITVQAEEVPPPGAAEFKSAGPSLQLSSNPPAPAKAAAPAEQVREAGKKGLKGVAGALLTAAALAMTAWFGLRYYHETQAWSEAKQGGGKGDYEHYLEKYPDSRHSGEARAILDSLNAASDTLSAAGGQLPVPAPADSAATAAPGPAADTIPTLVNDRPAKKPVATPKKTPEKPKKQAKPLQTPGGTQAPVATEGTKPELPAPVKTESLLRGENFAFKIPRFDVVENDKQYVFFQFYLFNQYREVLARLGSQGEAKLKVGMTLIFVAEQGEPVSAELKYVAQLPEMENRTDGYFTLSVDELTRFAHEKFKSVRLLDANRQAVKVLNFSRSGSKNLNRRAKEALEKLEEKK